MWSVHQLKHFLEGFAVGGTVIGYAVQRYYSAAIQFADKIGHSAQQELSKVRLELAALKKKL
jgi:hypothetical protein